MTTVPQHLIDRIALLGKLGPEYDLSHCTLQPCLTPAEVNEFEQRNQIKLPAAYANLVTTVANGIFTERADYQILFPLVDNVSKNHHLLGAVNSAFMLTKPTATYLDSSVLKNREDLTQFKILPRGNELRSHIKGCIPLHPGYYLVVNSDEEYGNIWEIDPYHCFVKPVRNNLGERIDFNAWLTNHIDKKLDLIFYQYIWHTYPIYKQVFSERQSLFGSHIDFEDILEESDPLKHWVSTWFMTQMTKFFNSTRNLYGDELLYFFAFTGYLTKEHCLKYYNMCITGFDKHRNLLQYSIPKSKYLEIERFIEKLKNSQSNHITDVNRIYPNLSLLRKKMNEEPFITPYMHKKSNDVQHKPRDTGTLTYEKIMLLVILILIGSGLLFFLFN